MPLLSHIITEPGQVLMCEFGPDPRIVQPPGIMVGPLGVFPEMFKERHSVVIVGRYRISTIVPLSREAPKKPEKFHHCIPKGKYPFLDPDRDIWSKSDMLVTVSNERLDRCFVDGKRTKVSLDPDDLKKVRETVLHAIGLGHLIWHLTPGT